MSAAPVPHGGRAVPWLVVAGVLVAALSMRGPIVAPTPVLREIEADLGIGSASAGLLTTVPVLMFAVMTPVAAIVIRRAGAELALMASLVGVLLGTLVRALPGFGALLAGSVVIGAAITVGNVVIPVVIRRDVPPERAGLMTAAYTATLNLGSLVTSLLTAPLASAVGWSGALVLWSVVTVAGTVLWGVHMRRAGDRWSRPRTAAPGPASARAQERDLLDPATLTGPLPVAARRRASGLRRPIAWLLMLTFAGQVLMYYALTTWLPTLASDELGLDATAAGALASVFQGVGVVGAFIVPLLARFAPPMAPVLLISCSWIALTAGTLLAPQHLWLWMVLGAVGHAGGFVVIFTVLVQVARSDAEAAAISALVQGGGYAIGALGAPLTGAMREATGGWSAPMLLLVGVSIVYGVLLVASRALARVPDR